MSELSEMIKPRLSEYVLKITTPSRRAGRDMFVCPLCGSGSGRHGTGAFHVTGEKWYCHSCQKGGDIFNLYGEMNRLDPNSKEDFPKIVDGLADELGISASDVARADFKNEIEKKPTPEPEDVKALDPERVSQIMTFASAVVGSPAEKYLRERGFSDQTIKKFNLGYDREKNAVVIPYPGTDYYTERYLSKDTGDKQKYFNLPGEAPVFVIKEHKANYYFITEGQLDALSMFQVGATNVIASHYPNKIKSWLEGKTVSGVVIVADRDDAGSKIADQMSEIFTKAGVKNLTVTPPEGFKDSNDMLRTSQDALKSLLLDALKDCQALPEIAPEGAEKALTAVSVSEFLTNGSFEESVAYFKQFKDRKTGFENIDKYLTLYPGLVCLTGSTSLGKTSFVVQLCDQLVQQGETVLYFTLEQDVFDITSKCIARRYFQTAETTHFDNTAIQAGATDADLVKVIQDYSKNADRFMIVQSDFTITASDICKYVEDFIKTTGIKPIFVVDYLQIVSAPDNSHFDEREKVDDAIKKFKLMQRNNGLFGIVISNMARSSYKERVSEDDFKESGLIEYTCDYLWGLQLSILENDSFFESVGSKGGKRDTTQAQRERKLYEASRAIPKDVVFVNMKQRKGRKVFKAFFKYRPDYDCFTPDLNSPYDPESATSAFSSSPFSKTEPISDSLSKDWSTDFDAPDFPIV